MMVDRSLATRLRVLRAERGLTLRQVDDMTGVGKGTLSGIERGTRHPQDRTLAKLAEGYGVPVEELLEEPVAALGNVPEEGRRVQEKRRREEQDIVLAAKLDEKLEHMEKLADLWITPSPQVRRLIGPYTTTFGRFARQTKELIAELKQTREESEKLQDQIAELEDYVCALEEDIRNLEDCD